MDSRRFLPRHAWLVLLASAALGPGSAQALTLDSLAGQQLEAIYGRYAPKGDCQRQPRISVDASGFAFENAGATTHSGRFEFAVSYMGPDYQGTSRWFFPFVVNDNDFGRILMVFNPDEKAGVLAFEPNLAPGQRLSPLQAALVKASPYARCGGQAAAAGSSRAASSAIPARPAPPAIPARPAAPAAPAAPLDWNNLGAHLGKYPGEFDLFGAGPIAAGLRTLLGKRIAVLRANLQVAGPLQRDGAVYYLSGNAPHRGGEDMAYVLIDATHHALRVGLWQGGKLGTYATPGVAIATPAEVRKMLGANPPANAVAAPGPGWQARPIAGRTPLALGVAAASPDIKTLSVFCERGQPMMAMLLHRAPSRGPLTLGLVFRGGLVELPMRRGNNAATLWLAELGNSALPRMLSQQTGVAYLRINGVMQGEVSMQGAAAASRSALGSCHRY